MASRQPSKAALAKREQRARQAREERALEEDNTRMEQELELQSSAIDSLIMQLQRQGVPDSQIEDTIRRAQQRDSTHNPRSPSPSS